MTKRIRTKKQCVHEVTPLSEARYTLSKDEKRILVLISQAAGDLATQAEDGWYKFNVRDYAQAYNLTIHEASRDVREAIENLGERWITVFDEIDGKETEIKMRWISKKLRRKSVGLYGVCFTEDIRPYIHELKDRISFPLEDVVGMTNTTHMRVYTWLYRVREIGELELGIDYMKDRLDLLDKKSYSLYGNFKKSVLVPAIQAINEMTPLSVEFEEIKEKNRVVKIRFIIKVDENKELLQIAP